MYCARFSMFIVVACFFVSTKVSALELGGIYDCISEKTISLQLTQGSNNSVSGQLRESGMILTITGTMTATGFAGNVESNGERSGITVTVHQDRLSLLTSDGDSLQFVRRVPADTNKSNSTSASSPALATNGTDVFVNNLKLSVQQITAIHQQYGVSPRPGRYWYDTRSGLYGFQGQPAAGFMLPGHELGTLASNASSGNVMVFINGRQLPQTEWLIWSVTLGYAIQPGRYWLDGNGNAGYEGSPYALVNLYQQAQRNAAARNSGGNGNGGGDHFWSSRFSAGNYDASSGTGYVSVPGYGPVGFGP